MISIVVCSAEKKHPAETRKHPPLILIECGVLLYLLSIPFGQSFPNLLREVMLATILVGLIWFRFSPKHVSRELPPLRFVLPVLLFGVSAVASVIFSSNPRFSLETSRFMPIALLFFIAIQHLGLTMPVVHRLCITLWCVVMMLSVDGLYQLLTEESLLAGRSLYGDRVTGSIPHPNDLALIPIFLPLVFVLLTVKLPAAVRWLLWISLPLAIATLIVSKSRNAWLGLAVCLVVWLAFGRQRKAIILSMVGFVLIFLAAYVTDLGGIRERLTSFTHLNQEGRIGIWLVAWEMFKDAPVFGLGSHVFGQHYLDYLTQIDFPQGYSPEFAFIPWAHNIYLEFLCERGLLGFTAFVVVVGAMVRQLIRSLKQTLTPEVRAYVAGLIGSLSVFLAMGLLDLTFLKDWIALVFWLLAALIARLPDLLNASSQQLPSGILTDRSQ